MLLGTMLGVLALGVLWASTTAGLSRLRLAVVLAGLYWLTQAGAILLSEHGAG